MGQLSVLLFYDMQSVGTVGVRIDYVKCLRVLLVPLLWLLRHFSTFCLETVIDDRIYAEYIYIYIFLSFCRNSHHL